MRHLTAIAAALGFFLAASAPSLAATTNNASIEFAAAKKKVDCTLPKNAKNKACVKKTDKKADLSLTFSAAKKKVDCTLPKNAKNKACKKM